MIKQLTFRKFRNEEDLLRVSEFRKRFFHIRSSMRSHEPEYYRWKCCSTPIQGEIWLAEDGGTLVGIKSITPRKIKVLGEVINGCEMGDAFTRPDYQRRGIFTELSKIARESVLEKGINFIYNSPNENSLPIYLKKLNHVHTPIKVRNLVKPLKTKLLLETKLKNSLLASLFSPIIEMISITTLKINNIGMSKKRDISVSQVSSFPDDIDTFWRQASNKYDVIPVRNQDWLKWRYIKNPDNYSIMISRNKDRAISGYIVTKTGSYEGIPFGFIVDFLSLEDDANIFKKLVLITLERFYHKKLNIISTWTIKGSFYDKIFLKMGFFHYKEIPILWYKNEVSNQIINKVHKWHFTMGDSDNI